MKMSNIAIVGNGVDAASVSAKLIEMSRKNIEVITVDDAQNMIAARPLNATTNEPYIIHNTRMIAPYMPNRKEFICKGRHQYSRIVTGNLVEWVCQCGRKITP